MATATNVDPQITKEVFGPPDDKSEEAITEIIDHIWEDKGNLYNGFYEHQRKNHIYYSVQIPYTLARPQTRCTSMYPRVQLDFA